ncbi:MAG: dihydroorotate dehydrogenase electron transfer subunit [Clostridia bacterium]|nr:dihydroorotate dehydrogenase electron transfer subunit [Clostridia bacterium]
MKQAVLTVQENEHIAKSVYRMTLSGDLSDVARPGQFVNLKLDGFYLRRPISVCDKQGDLLTLIYKTVGDGTRALAGYGKGKEIDCLVGLGNGYDVTKSGDAPLLVGGGVGVPPLYWLAKTLIDEGKRVTAILGFNTKDEVFFENEFRALGANVIVTTVDGSCGKKGFVTDALTGLDFTYVYTCGPEPMLRALYRATKVGGQFSFERRMGCGFGACMGCTCKTITGNKRICREGPVLTREDIVWED